MKMVSGADRVNAFPAPAHGRRCASPLRPLGRRLACGLLSCLLLAAAPAAFAGSPRISLRGPDAHPQEYEVALDEIELDWSRAPAGQGPGTGRRAAVRGEGTVLLREGARAILAIPPAAGTRELQARAEALRAANPGAEAFLVLYEPDHPRSQVTRRLLTREVGLVLEAGQDAAAAVAGLPVEGLRPVAGVPGGFVVDAAEPLAAPELAEALSQRPGVRSAYPLLRRQFFRR